MALRRKFSASAFWDDIDRYQCTCFAYIGELCRYLLLQPERTDDASHGVTKIIGNGLRPELWMRFKQRFGIERVMEFYAASESNNIFINLGNVDQTVGYSPGPWKLVKYDIDQDLIVRDARGHAIPVPDGEAGLLVTEITDRWKLDGYTDEQATQKKVLRNLFKKGDAWFNSGDLLRVIKHGWWPPLRHAQFVDRVGDTFRWKGENVSTTEVEEIVAAFPGVQECTVYGVQVPGADGRAGMAMLVLANESAFDWTAFATYLEASLPSYARPLFARVGGEIETTGTFKYRKVDLRDAGFDPSRAGRVRMLQDGTYKALTQARYAAIAAGSERVG
jgi:citronellyl-CoA synthetase